MDLLPTCERVITSVILDIVVITSWNECRRNMASATMIRLKN
ncbi:hypothetical protein CH54_2853 [Yersinia rochesterensis]|uniref:Uncharacterized protein n=1 Tax=Yersinia rochesterensis TaxID=1604335 RepID=A0ABN4FI96_9GAMM|nr:hypothetical protein DJ57_3670 [Yersinia rochesterensis]AJJ36961.1 hypothetical protein CH54_2853 [Yersinia rochesterensis]CRY62438.1 Uncharacterised protein [Yersinia kristensenii]